MQEWQFWLLMYGLWWTAVTKENSDGMNAWAAFMQLVSAVMMAKCLLF